LGLGRATAPFAPVRPEAPGQAALLEELHEAGDGEILAGRFRGFAAQQKAPSVIGDGRQIAIASID